MTTGTLALIILAAILLQVAVPVLIWLNRVRGQQRDQAGHTSSPTPLPVTVPSTAAEPVATGLAWKGFREFRIRRRVYEDENRSICSFYLVPLDGEPLPSFKPGQFLTFRLPLEDPVSGAPVDLVRCYSLSDRARADGYRISIKRVPAPAGRPELPPGRSSGFFHDHLSEGDRLMVKAPSGHFHLVEKPPLPVVLIGGGIGITPMLSILETVLESGSSREIWLYYGVTNGAEVIMHERLQQLAQTHTHFHLHLCYSRPRDQEREGVDYRHQGWVDIPLLRATLALMRYQFYVCGPRAMMENLVPGLEGLGVDANDIHYESFGPATLARHPRPEAKGGPTPAITVTFSRSGAQAPWNAGYGSLLELAEAQGVAVASGCRAGSCGSCQTALETGEVDYSQQPDADVAPGHCLLCITSPRNDLTLAA